MKLILFSLTSSQVCILLSSCIAVLPARGGSDQPVHVGPSLPITWLPPATRSTRALALGPTQRATRFRNSIRRPEAGGPEGGRNSLHPWSEGMSNDNPALALIQPEQSGTRGGWQGIAANLQIFPRRTATRNDSARVGRYISATRRSREPTEQNIGTHGTPDK